ncbi:MAG TPA: hypothetical protein VGH13_03020 [Xanthobacteraceae bacterium]
MRSSTIALILCTTCSMSAGAAQAESCTQQVDQLQATIQQASTAPIDEPTAPETTGAKLGHQPTPSSVGAAESSAKSRLASLLAEARALDEQGKPAACMQTLDDAKEILAPP